MRINADELAAVDDGGAGDQNEDSGGELGGGEVGQRKRMQVLLDVHANGRKPAEIARDTGGRVLIQTVIKYWDGKTRDSRMPALPTIQGFSDALGMPDDTEVGLALLKDMGARIKAPGTALARSLPQIAYVLDDHPELIAAYAREITQVCLALMAERRRAAPKNR